MSKQRPQYRIDAENRYKQRHKRINIVFNSNNYIDVETLQWLRSQVTTDSEIPALIKAIVNQAKNS
jgi:hypothetical protein